MDVFKALQHNECCCKQWSECIRSYNIAYPKPLFPVLLFIQCFDMDIKNSQTVQPLLIMSMSKHVGRGEWKQVSLIFMKLLIKEQTKVPKMVYEQHQVFLEKWLVLVSRNSTFKVCTFKFIAIITTITAAGPPVSFRWHDGGVVSFPISWAELVSWCLLVLCDWNSVYMQCMVVLFPKDASDK